ncbi:MAG: type III polyketide synthase [Myxococcota bacterium]
MHIASVGQAFPDHYYDQNELVAAFLQTWGPQFHNPARIEQLHKNVLVGGRHLALPLEHYDSLTSFTDTNDTFIRLATDLGARAVEDGLQRAGLDPQQIDHLFFVSVTGVATPSIDAKLVNRMGLRSDVKRTPIFGLGCVAGAAGISRAFDYLQAYPDQASVLLSVELCSLTLQKSDLSMANIISSGLFGDGAAALVMTGARRTAMTPEVLATKSVFYPNSEDVMGWEITSDGFKVVLSADVPKVVKSHIREDVDRFLSDHGLSRRDIGCYVCHPGGPKVLEAFQQALELPQGALQVTWDSLRRVGNLSSASILMVLRDTMAHARPQRGTYGLMIAMGPGFCSELVLVRW